MNFANLTTEQRNSASANIDKVSTLEMVKIINDGKSFAANCARR